MQLAEHPLSHPRLPRVILRPALSPQQVAAQEGRGNQREPGQHRHDPVPRAPARDPLHHRPRTPPRVRSSDARPPATWLAHNTGPRPSGHGPTPQSEAPAAGPDPQGAASGVVAGRVERGIRSLPASGVATG
jgi:hypothetical protein